MTREQFLANIITEIELLKARGKKGLYKIGVKIPDHYAKYLQSYFSEKSGDYEISIRKCSHCSGKWDISITFIKI